MPHLSKQTKSLSNVAETYFLFVKMEENCSDLRRKKKLVENIYRLFLGEEKISNDNCSLVKLNEENLSKYGDVCFLTQVDTWRKLFPHNSNLDNISSCRNLLEYYLMKNGIEYDSRDEDITEKAFRNIIRASENWLFKIVKCTLRNERVCLFLNRKITFAETLSRIVSRDVSYGEFHPKTKSYRFNIVYDKDSQLTNLRLRLIKGVAENIIKANGYQISDNTDAAEYHITTRSKTGSEDLDYKIILCGVAKNHKTKSKEITITENQYRDQKLRELLDTTENKSLDSNLTIGRIAEAAIALEFLAVKPSRAITIASGVDSANGKGSSFVLYNTARIAAILDRFEDESSKGNYPKLADIEDIDFSLLDQEEEWELAYNFLLGYPETIESCVRFEEGMEISPHYICSFLSRFCNKFSAYYRRVRILTEGRNHLLPTMMARLYLLKAVQIVIRNALRLLDIDPVSRM